MSQEEVFQIHEAYKLTDSGIPTTQCTWPRVTLSNSNLTCIIHSDDKYTSVESVQSTNSKDYQTSKVTIINGNGKIVSRSKTVAESAKIHPTKPIIALKAQNVFKVYNFETKLLLNDLEVLHDVCFWKWVNEDTIILVTETSVYQWGIFTERGDWEFVCNRLPRLNYTEIVNCAVDDHHRWYAVTGLLDHGKGALVEGVTQVYSADYGLSQCIEAHTVTFTSHRFTDSVHESAVMCAASRHLDSVNGKVHTVELGSAMLSQTIPRLASSDIKFIPCTTSASNSAEGECLTKAYCGASSTRFAHGTDFPVSIQADSSHCVLYILTKFGRLYVAELESAVILAAHTQICSHITFCASLDSLSTLTVISKASQVLRISVDWLLLIKKVETIMKWPELAKRLRNSRGMENVDLLLSE